MPLKNIKWPNSSPQDSDPDWSISPTHKTKWRTIIGLILMYIAVLLNWYWFWGLLSLYLVLPSLYFGVTYFVEPIARQENPILFWIISITWIAFSIVLLFPQGG
ncbi:MAG: hypothetical protein F6J87_23545 [Spirulina sp. SIO3F2]|nr:hypothetical protein [Spirulina sp. SIO3F2]